MSGLIDINAIALNESNIGTNVNDRFDKIDENFKRILGSDYLRGDRGDDIIVGSVMLFNEKPEDRPDKIDPTKYKEGRDLFDKFYNLIVGEDAVSGDVAEVIKNELHKRQIMKIYSNSSSTASQSFLGTYMPFVFKDPRLKQLDNVDTSTTKNPYTGFTDYSCCIYYDNEKNDDPWVKLESMPNIYFNEELYQFCWKINGMETNLIAQGPAGPNGIPGSNVLLVRIPDGSKENIDENLDLAHDITHFFVSNEENPSKPGKWIDVKSEDWNNHKHLLVLNNNAATLAITRSIKDPILDENGNVQYGVVYADKDGNIEYECKCKCGYKYGEDDTVDKCPNCNLDKTDENIICSPVPVEYDESLHGNSEIVYVDENGEEYSQYNKGSNDVLLEIIRKTEYYWYLGILRLIEEENNYNYSFVTSKDSLNDIFQNVLDNIYTKGEVNNFIEELREVDDSLESAITTEIEERQDQDESLRNDISDIVGFVAGVSNVSDLDRSQIESSDPEYGDNNVNGRNLLAAVNSKYDKIDINSKVGSMDYQMRKTNYNLSKYDILEPNIQVIDMKTLESNPNPTVDIDLELNKLTRVILSDASDKLSGTNLTININLPLMEERKPGAGDDDAGWPYPALEEPLYERNIFPGSGWNRIPIPNPDDWNGIVEPPETKYNIDDYKWEDNWMYRTVTKNEVGNHKWGVNSSAGFATNIVGKDITNENTVSTEFEKQLWNELEYATNQNHHLSYNQKPTSDNPGVWDTAVGIYHTALQLPPIKDAVIKIMCKYNDTLKEQIYPDGVKNEYQPFGDDNDNVILKYHNRAYIAHNFKKTNIKTSPIAVTTEAPSEWIMTGYYEITKNISIDDKKFIKNYSNIWNIATAEYGSEPALSEEPMN